MNWKNVLERALWQFVFGAVGVVTVLPAFTDLEGWANLGASAGAAGVSALLSFLKTVAQDRLLGSQILYREDPLV